MLPRLSCSARPTTTATTAVLASNGVRSTVKSWRNTTSRTMPHNVSIRMSLKMVEQGERGNDECVDDDALIGAERSQAQHRLHWRQLHHFRGRPITTRRRFS